MIFKSVYRMIQIRNEKYPHCRYNNNNNIFTSSCLVRNYKNQNIENKIRVLAAWNNHGVWLSQPGQQNTVAQMRTQLRERNRREKTLLLCYQGSPAEIDPKFMYEYKKC